MSFNFSLMYRLILALSSRLFRSHAEMKYQIMKLLKHRTDVDYLDFLNTIDRKKRELTVLKDKTFDIKILATAAPACYAKIIAEKEQFDVCLATDFPDSNFNSTFENSKKVKKENVMNYLKEKNLYVIDTLVTDHIDDLPLMKLAKRTIIIRPSEHLLNQIKQFSISFEVIE
jgi:phosphoserine phosphatase